MNQAQGIRYLARTFWLRQCPLYASWMASEFRRLLLWERRVMEPAPKKKHIVLQNVILCASFLLVTAQGIFCLSYFYHAIVPTLVLVQLF
mgnify:CR=1 FL=1